MNYQSVLDYLYGLTDYEKDRIARYDPDTLDLSRVQRVLARLGDPHQRFPSVHIAGTKGKGSVAAICASVLHAAGLRVGLYTSPHLHSFRERIQLNGELIPAETLTVLLQECRPVFDGEPELTTFEAITALAFTYFGQQQVDFAVVEVGLGGRLDATNVITPQVAVITSLSYDHTYLLGNTLAEIAREKAGIIKPGVPTVCMPQTGEALAVIQQVCDERGSSLTLVGRDWTWEAVTAPGTSNGAMHAIQSLDGQTFELRRSEEPSQLEGTYTTPLLGRHQVTNALAAVAALDLLERSGVPLQPHHVRAGLAAVRWPGRFEILERDPLLVVDCAHNGDSATKLALALEDWFPGCRWTIILGASIDKDVPGILRALDPRTDFLVATQSRHPRAVPAEQLAKMAAHTVAAEVAVATDVGAALDLALSRANVEPSQPYRRTLQGGARSITQRTGPICVTGSIFVVADAREAWALYKGSDLPETDHRIGQGLLPLGHSQKAHTQAVAC